MAISDPGDGGPWSVTGNSGQASGNLAPAQPRTGYGDVSSRQKAKTCSDFWRLADAEPTSAAQYLTNCSDSQGH
jgi:hypothetical protein